jgi:hypothetical protein
MAAAKMLVEPAKTAKGTRARATRGVTNARARNTRRRLRSRLRR